MSKVLAALDEHASRKPLRLAVEGLSEQWTYVELAREVDKFAQWLERQNIRSAALLADNTPAWIAADLASIRAGIALTPVPHFFSPSQVHHLLGRSAAGLVLTDRPGQLERLLEGMGISHESCAVQAWGLAAFRIDTGQESVGLSAATSKITFTSGSTGEPKGVCLAQKAMETVALSLLEATQADERDRHLALLPYATLLENIGGVYAPLLAGATIVAPGLASVGLGGASSLDVPRFVSAITESRATTCIMIPQMLQGLVAGLAQGAPRAESLRYVAVGGAPVSRKLLQQAERLGVPAFEGYGLSEAASVVAVNTPSANRPGSVGRPLAHVELRFAEDGEILVRGSLFEGYLGESVSFDHGFWPTGDIGYMDEDGFLHLNGRKKHIFITAFGRNVSPEWVESELMTEPSIAQCCVFGEARPFNVAVIVPRPSFDAAAVAAAVEAANERLPDYARVGRFLLAAEPFTVDNGQWTGTGRPRRGRILAAYADKIEKLYEE